MSISIVCARHVADLADLYAVFGLAFESERTGAAGGNFSSLLGRNDICFLVALSEGVVVGGLSAYEMELLSGEKEFYLYDIGVHPAHQRKGLGAMLIKELKKQAQARGISTIFVEAESDDSGAVSFYKSLGAEQIKVDHFN